MKLVIFDFDGVLVDTLSVCFSLNAEVNKDLSLEEYKCFFEGNINEAINANGKSKSYRPDFFEQYGIRNRELKIPEELKHVIAEPSSVYKLVIISSTDTSFIQDILRREGVHPSFSDILGNDVHKSKVFKIKMLFEKYNVITDDVVFITDTVGDIKEARECGVPAIAVTWGFHEEIRLVKAGPARIVRTPDTLLKAVKEIL